jgi:hypothetical protein
VRILELETTGVRALPDAAWTFDPNRSGAGHLTVVTGAQQVGLTSFLEAIAASAARLGVGGLRPDAADVLRVGGATATIRTEHWLDADERAFGGVTEETLAAEVVFKREGLGRADADPALLGLMSRYDHTTSLSKVVIIPARRVADGGVPMLGDFEAEQQWKHLSSDTGKFAGIPSALIKHAAGFGERARFERVQELFGALSESTRLADVGTAGLEFSIAAGLRVPLSRLGFSDRNALVLAASVVLQGLERSIILLDTPEMGLAPGVAMRWLDVLRKATPEAQWIVATRDPAVLAGVPPEAQITLKRP